jgi:hypothetical protein
MNDWKIQSRARTCQCCGRAFAAEEVYHTLLFEQRTGFERLDVCHTCWDEQYRHGAADRKGFISHWQGTYLLPPAAPPEPIQRDSAETWLRRLNERTEPEWQAARFILAVMLERKRILKNRDQLVEDGRRLFVYELPRTGESFIVADPRLRLDQLQQVQREVSGLLQQGLPEDITPTAADVGSPAPPQNSDLLVARP